MTEIKPRNEKKSRAENLSAGQLLFCLTSAAVIVLTLWRSEVTSEAMLGAVKMCLSTVIPSLFSFMVLCEIFVSSGAADIFARFAGRAFEKLFGIGRDGAAAVLLGLVFGFPVGTKSAVSLYERGRIDKKELCHLLCFCNGPSSAFLISVVGVGLFGSRAFGLLLCAAEIFSAVVIAITARVFFRPDASLKPQKAEILQDIPQKRRGGALSIVDAVTSSSLSMLYICAFIVFFSAITGIADDCARALGIGQTWRAMLTGFFEMTGGVRAIAGAEIDRYAACILVAAAVGWSGLSVHFQFISLCKDTGVSFRSYFISKAARAALDLCFVAAALSAFGEKIEFGESTASSFLWTGEFHLIYLVSIVTVAATGVRKLKIENGKLKVKATRKVES